MATFKGTPRHTDKAKSVQDPRKLQAALNKSSKNSPDSAEKYQDTAAQIDSKKQEQKTQENKTESKPAQQKKPKEKKVSLGERRKSGTTKIAHSSSKSVRLSQVHAQDASKKLKSVEDTQVASVSQGLKQAEKQHKSSDSVSKKTPSAARTDKRARKTSEAETVSSRVKSVQVLDGIKQFACALELFFKHYGRIIVLVVSILALLLAAMYFPAKHFYIAKRTQERLQQEYELNIAHNAQLREDLEKLQTPEGIEDEARKHMGLVREGEHAVSVTGITAQPGADDPEHLKRVEKGSGVAEKHWWTYVLDAFFGLEDTSIDPRYQKVQEENN